MSNLLQSQPDSRPSGRRFLAAMALGHLAGAYAYVLTMIPYAVLSDLQFGGPAAIMPSTWSHLFEGIVAFPIVTGILGLWAGVLMIPSVIFTLPVAWMAAYRLRAGAAATVALGAVTGVLAVLAAFREASKLDLQPYVSAAVAGGAFAWVVWRMCIRTRPSLSPDRMQ